MNLGSWVTELVLLATVLFDRPVIVYVCSRIQLGRLSIGEHSAVGLNKDVTMCPVPELI